MSAAADWRLALVTGVATGLAAAPFWQPDGEWIRPLLALVLVVVLAVERGRTGRIGLALIALAAAMVGLLVGGARLEAIADQALESPPGPVALRGFVTEPPSDSRGTARFPFESERGRVLVEVPSGQAGDLAPGDGLLVRGQLGRAPDWLAGDLGRQGISMVLKAGRLIPTGDQRGGLGGLIDQLRNRAFAALEVAVPEREAALSKGFVLGDDSDVDARTTEDFQRSGLSHLLAVSGQNVVLLALLAIPLLSLAGVSPRTRLPVIALLILVYVPLAGGGPSIQRAGVMGIAALVAIAAARAPSRVYALALAALVTLGLNPSATADVGWQLSFAAVVGIMLLARPLQDRFAGSIGEEGWRRTLSESAAVTVAATIATAPLIAFHFERLPLATLAANLVAMPAVAPAMWLGMVGVAVGQLSPTLAAPFNLVGSVCLAWIAQIAEWFGRPDWAVVEVKLDGPLMLLLVTALVSLLAWAGLRWWPVDRVPGRRGRWIPAGGLVLLILILVLSGLNGGRRELAEPPPGGARIEVLDVGQGDAILIRPANASPILLDGGPPGGDLAGALESAGVDRLSAALLTHPDLDHYGGLLDLFGRFPVERLLFDHAPPELLSLARGSGASLRRIGAGALIRNGDVRLRILWPPSETGSGRAGEGTETNQRSIVALLAWRDFRMLLTGDAEAESVPIDPGPVDVLKVSHHGSEDAGLPALLDESDPRLAVIPVGEGNPYGHPVPKVLGDLAAEGIETFRTDRDGTISIVLDPGSGYRVESGR